MTLELRDVVFVFLRGLICFHRFGFASGHRNGGVRRVCSLSISSAKQQHGKDERRSTDHT